VRSGEEVAHGLREIPQRLLPHRRATAETATCPDGNHQHRQPDLAHQPHTTDRLLSLPPPKDVR
jgi:hypothetical protein